MSTARLSWRYFWSRRPRWRITLAVILALGALLIIVYLAVPTEMQVEANQAVLRAGQEIAALNRALLLGGLAALLGLLCIGIVFWRPYRRHRYLVTAPSAIPPVSVYIDAENQVPESAVRPFTKFLMDYLGGRRADLLYFLDASQTANSDQYQSLYRFGFRPVDVPHDPTGDGKVKEAVDREIAMHAYERALLGPPGQEFIIVTGDRDYVPLVYRLVALGHRVQIWASPIREAYRTLATYLDVGVLDVTRTIADLPDVTDSEESLYRVIKASRKARASAEKLKASATDKMSALRSNLGDMTPRLDGVGYVGSGRIDRWIEHLTALDVLKPASRVNDKDQLPDEGINDEIEAARQLYLVAQATAAALAGLAADRNGGVVRWDELAPSLAAALERSADNGVKQFIPLLRQEPASRGAGQARSLARCARALGLVTYEEGPSASGATVVAPPVV